MSKRKTKFVLLTLFTVLSLFLIYPQSDNLVTDGKWNPDTKAITFSVISPSFKSYLQSAGLPQVIKTDTYNLYISNENEIYNISYYLTFNENDPILPYLETIIGSSTPTIDGHPGFIIKSGKNYLVKNIPSAIPVLNQYGEFASCGVDSVIDNCPANVSEELTKNIQISSHPNVDRLSFFAELVLILSFWMVVMNSASEFFSKKD